MLELKQNIKPEELCKGLPNCFVKYFEYVLSLEFEQKPDYKYLQSLFDDKFKALKFVPVK